MKLYRSSLPWPQHGGSVWIRLTYPVIFKSFTVPSQRMNISEFVKRVYLCLFYTPNGWSSKRCVENLHQWTKRTRKQLSFAINMVWQEQKNHVDDCYFCLTKTSSMACTTTAPPPNITWNFSWNSHVWSFFSCILGIEAFFGEGFKVFCIVLVKDWRKSLRFFVFPLFFKYS